MRELIAGSSRPARWLALGALVVSSGCASPGSPPGGPPDTQAPQIVRVTPDSGTTGVSPRGVIIRFDEVVSERPAGAASLNALFLISPREGEPRVGWHRNAISVRPRRGWRPNTAYTVTMLPGVSDLRGNVRNTGVVTIFSTGASIPDGRITGTVFNWIESRTVLNGLVEARPVSDTTIVHVTTTDSAGTFVLATLAPGDYIVRGSSDDNRNRGLDPREPWDSVRVSLADSIDVEILAFTHDSIGSRLQSVNLRDSVTIELVFDNTVSPDFPPIPGQLRVQAGDSSFVNVVAVDLPSRDTAAAGVRRPSRPPPTRTFRVTLGSPLVPEVTYRVAATDIPNILGVRRSSERTFTAPARPPAAVPSPPPSDTLPAQPPDSVPGRTKAAR